jgi:hypothetical protein
MAITLFVLLVAVFAYYHLAGQRLELLVQTSIGAANKLRFNFAGDASGPPAISPDSAHIVFFGKERRKRTTVCSDLKRSVDPAAPGQVGDSQHGGSQLAPGFRPARWQASYSETSRTGIASSD